MKNKDKDISAFGSIIYFFKNFYQKLKELKLPQKFIERQKRIALYTDEGSSYESRLSFKFNLVKIIFVALLCVFSVFTLIFGGRALSYENVYYMFKDINYISDYNESIPSSLSYSEPFNNQDFAQFKNGLAVVSDREYKFFTLTGRTTLMNGSDYTDPRICTSDSTALIYDAGKNDFSVYNSFICVYSEKLEYPINFADMADDGSFVLVTRSKNYATSARIYNSDFEIISEYSKNDYIISSKMTSDGKYTVFMSLDSLDGDKKVTVSVLRNGRSELYSSFVNIGDMPYSFEILSNDKIAVFYDSKFVIYNFKGSVKEEYVYPSTLTYVCADKNGFTLAFKDNAINSSLLISFDENGNQIRLVNLDASLYSLARHGNYVYALCEKEVLRIDTKWGGKASVPFASDGGELLVLSGGDVLVCTEISAYYLDFN